MTPEIPPYLVARNEEHAELLRNECPGVDAHVNKPLDTHYSVLLEAQSLVHGNRGADYGHPLDDYTRTAGMVSAMLAHILKRPIQADEMIQIMICVKLSRQVNKPKRDNTVDGAGYFECLQMAIDEFERRSTTQET